MTYQVRVFENQKLLAFTGIKRTGNSIELSWIGATPGKSYQVDYAVSSDSPVWTPLGSPVLATSETLTYIDVISEKIHFYRIRELE